MTINDQDHVPAPYFLGHICKNGKLCGHILKFGQRLRWFSVGICKYKPGYKSHDLL